jgi:hypothetical protein
MAGVEFFFWDDPSQTNAARGRANHLSENQTGAAPHE